MSAISKLLLNLWGWRVVCEEPLHLLKKYVVVVIPHTSNWDFPLGLLVRSVLKENILYLGKASLFKFPFGILFRALGGYPVVRDKRTNFVDAVVQLLNSKEKMAVCIAPEGTRKKVDELKTGFYYMAHGANAPLILCKFDWGTKVVTFSKSFYTTGDYDKDFEQIKAYFKDAKGYHPENGVFYEGK